MEIELKMKLYLVQHGEATDKDIDPDRPLTDKGHDDIRKMSELLKCSNIELEQVIHSGKLRAKETAEYYVKLLSTPSSLIENNNINPKDELSPLIDEIESWNSDTLIVGHLPYLAKLSSMLLANNDATLSVSFKPGTVVCLERDDNNNWSLNWMIRPELLNN